MGLIQSLLCSCTFCLERVLTWTCCAFLLILIMSTIVILITYGISMGYHYSQKQIVKSAHEYRATTEPIYILRSENELLNIGRRFHANQSENQLPPQFDNEDFRNYPVKLTEPVTERTEIGPYEEQLAKYVIGRFRRSRNITNPPGYTKTSTTLYKVFQDRFLTNRSVAKILLNKVN